MCKRLKKQKMTNYKTILTLVSLSFILGTNACKNNDNKGDIIPSFQYGDPENPTTYPGKNWNFVFSNGRNEGDFVLTSLERTINQTDGEGNFIDITCNIVLKEFANANSNNRQLEQDRKKAFAVSSNRPLPANSDVVPVNPALNVTQENLKVQQWMDSINH